MKRSYSLGTILLSMLLIGFAGLLTVLLLFDSQALMSIILVFG